MTLTMRRTAPELSCYTTNLVAYLDAVRRGEPAAARVAGAVRLSVRTDLPGGTLAFSHHTRIDDGALSYRSSREWEGARAALLAELAGRGAVLAVGNARHLPWSPHHGCRDISHWILILGHGDAGWEVADDFDALLPSGTQHPYRGRLHESALRAALTPVGRQEPHRFHRDLHALGPAVPPGSPEHYRWLHHAETPETPAEHPAGDLAGHPGEHRAEHLAQHPGEHQAERPGEHQAERPAEDGVWIEEPLTVLQTVRDRLTADDVLLEIHGEDVWAAARHHCHRAAWLAAEDRLAPDSAGALIAGWSALPRALRFAADSAARGRRRTGAVTRAFDDLAEVTARLRERP